MDEKIIGVSVNRFFCYDLKVNVLPTVMESGETVKMTVTFKCAKPFSDPECVNLFNVLFKRIFDALRMCQMNRNYYNPNAAISIPQHK